MAVWQTAIAAGVEVASLHQAHEEFDAMLAESPVVRTSGKAAVLRVLAA